MSFANIISGMSTTHFAIFGETAVLMPAVGGVPKDTRAIVDEPVENAVAGYPRHALREQRMSIWLPRDMVLFAPNARLEVKTPGKPDRLFKLGAQIDQDPDRVKFTADEVAAWT